MGAIRINKFEISDIPGMSTLAFLVEEDNSTDFPFYSLQKLDAVETQSDGKVNKEYSVINTENGERQDIVLLTFANNKAIISSGYLTEEGFAQKDDNESISFGRIFNTDGIEYKEFAYTPNMKRKFTIIDTVTLDEVKPVVFKDEITNEIKGRCKILPLRPYIVLEVNKAKARMVGMTTDIEKTELQYTKGVQVELESPGLELDSKDSLIV